MVVGVKSFRALRRLEELAGMLGVSLVLRNSLPNLVVYQLEGERAAEVVKEMRSTYDDAHFVVLESAPEAVFPTTFGAVEASSEPVEVVAEEGVDGAPAEPSGDETPSSDVSTDAG